MTPLIPKRLERPVERSSTTISGQADTVWRPFALKLNSGHVGPFLQAILNLLLILPHQSPAFIRQANNLAPTVGHMLGKLKVVVVDQRLDIQSDSRGRHSYELE